MATVIDTNKAPTFLGTYLPPVPANESADSWPAHSVFQGAQDALEVYATEAAKIRDADLSEFVDPAGRKRAALQKFAATLIDARNARYRPLLDSVATRIATNQAALESKSKAGTDPVRTAAIWQLLAAQGADGLQRKIEHAVRTKDREAIAATLSAPLVFNFIPNDTDRTRIADGLLRTVDEAAYDRLTDLRAALQCAENAWQRCQSFVRSDSGLGATESAGA